MILRLALFFLVASASLAPTVVVGNASQPDSSTTNGLSVAISADLVSRYIWRGAQYSTSPHIMPSGSLSYKGFSFGAWGSYGLSDSYAEIDLYLSYEVGGFCFMLYDYFNENETALDEADYFRWNKKDSPHILEATIMYEGPESYPVSLTAATFFWGNDRKPNGDNYFSTYLEAAYTFELPKATIRLFAGGTTGKGYYSERAGIVNVGLTASKAIEITKTCTLPVYCEFIMNPSAGNVFLVFGITL